MMSQDVISLATVYEGWENYQDLLIKAIAPLTDEQLQLRPAPHLRSIYETINHIIGARTRWFSQVLGEGGETFVEYSVWDRANQPVRTASELVEALKTTWRVVHALLESWTPDDLTRVFEESETESITRQWVLWHLIEHDLHHGGEISLTLGIHKLEAPDL